MIVVGVEAGRFQTDDQLFPVLGVFNQVVNVQILAYLVDGGPEDIIALPVVGVVVGIKQLDCLLGVFPAQQPDQELLQLRVPDPVVHQVLNLIDGKLLVNYFLELVLVPILSEQFQTRRVLPAQLGKYFRVVRV